MERFTVELSVSEPSAFDLAGTRIIVHGPQDVRLRPLEGRLPEETRVVLWDDGDDEHGGGPVYPCGPFRPVDGVWALGDEPTIAEALRVADEVEVHVLYIE